jgi:hypothetical protein
VNDESVGAELAQISTLPLGDTETDVLTPEQST